MALSSSAPLPACSHVSCDIRISTVTKCTYLRTHTAHIRGIYCCCNYKRWQRIEEEREEKREKLIAKSRRHFDPADRVVPSYGTYETLQMEEGRGGQERAPPRPGILERAVELHRSGELGAGNISKVPDF